MSQEVPVRPGPLPTTQPKSPGPIGSATVLAERSLHAELRRAARRTLGPNATDAEVRKLASDWYNEPPPEMPPETDAERRQREQDEAEGLADVEEHHAKYGDMW